MTKARSGQRMTKACGPFQDSKLQEIVCRKPLHEMITNATHTNHILKRPNDPASAKLGRAATEPFSDKLNDCKSFFTELLASNVCI